MNFLRLVPFLFLLLLLPACRTNVAPSTSSGHPNNTNTLSTDWFLSAIAELPARYHDKDLNFEQITNLLGREAQQGNAAAMGLWGFAIVSRSQSPEEKAAGLELLRGSAANGYVPAMLNLGYLCRNGKYGSTNDAFHWFQMAANSHDPEGEAQLGNCYFTGRGTIQDYSLAAEWFGHAADHKNFDAMKSLGYMSLEGLGVDKDLVTAKYWSERAAKEGNNRRAMLNLGSICVMEATNDPSMMAEAFRWYLKSAELGDPLACHEVANFYYNGWGVVKTNIDSYHQWLFKAAELGCTGAQFFMGQIYRTGNGAPADMEQALKWYRKAAEKNDPRALFDLAVYYFQQKTNRASLEMAVDYVRRAAEGGHREAQFQYALSLFRGDVPPADFDAGQAWLAKSAENGWARAQFVLYELYSKGSSPAAGSPKYTQNKVEAVKWLRRAANQGDYQAQSSLAVMLITGKGIDQDKTEGEKLLRYAAARGFPTAQNDLGYAIVSGDTSKRDWVEAAVWCKLAKLRSTDTNDVIIRAGVNFAKASGQLTPDELAEVDRRVAEFRPLPTPTINPLVPDWDKNPEYRREDVSDR